MGTFKHWLMGAIIRIDEDLKNRPRSDHTCKDLQGLQRLLIDIRDVKPKGTLLRYRRK